MWNKNLWAIFEAGEGVVGCTSSKEASVTEAEWGEKMKIREVKGGARNEWDSVGLCKEPDFIFSEMAECGRSWAWVEDASLTF